MKSSRGLFIVVTMITSLAGTGIAKDALSQTVTWLAASNIVASKPVEYEKPIPITFSLDYTLVSDYMWRGQDYTKFTQGPSQQVTVGAEVDLGAYGRVGGEVWFQFQSAYHFHGCLMEVDYLGYYGYTIEPIGLDIEVGFMYYEIPHFESDNTQEIYTVLTWDDSILWRAFGLDVEEPVLNPYCGFYFDIDEARGVYGDFGISHEFELADCGCEDVPILQDTTFGLNWSMGWANDWGTVDDYSGPMTMQYGLTTTLDLKSILSLPDMYCGEFYLEGFLNYNHPLTNNASSFEAMMVDKVWGGVSIGYAW